MLEQEDVSGSSLLKVDCSPQTPCLALAKLRGAGAPVTPCSFPVLTLLPAVPPGIWYPFLISHFTRAGEFCWLLLVLSCYSHSFPTHQTAIVGFVSVSNCIHFNCTLKITPG